MRKRPLKRCLVMTCPGIQSTAAFRLAPVVQKQCSGATRQAVTASKTIFEDGRGTSLVLLLEQVVSEGVPGGFGCMAELEELCVGCGGVVISAGGFDLLAA